MKSLHVKTEKVWFITGASTGLGRSLAEEIIAAGGKVVATARNIDKVMDLQNRFPDQVHAARLDVLDGDTVTSAVESGLHAFGRIDVLVNNAGFGSLGAIEDLSEEQIHRQFETNVFGLLRVTQAILPTLRKQGSGYILNVSSVAGRKGMPAFGIYSASKFAVEGISEALSQEVSAFGIQVISVEPGAFLTDFIEAVERPAMSETYEHAYGALMSMAESMVYGDPAKAGRAIIHVVESGNAPQKLALGVDAYEMIQAKLTADLESYKQLESVTCSTAFDDPARGKIPALSIS